MKSLVAGNFMSKRVKSIPPNMNAKEALKKLLKSGASGLPVMDGRGRLCGVFTEKEILKAVSPAYLADVGAFKYGEGSKSELKKMSHLGKFKVRDIMRKEVPTLGENTSLTEVSHIMLMRNERRVIVTMGSKVVGIITRSDVVGAFAREAGIFSPKDPCPKKA